MDPTQEHDAPRERRTRAGAGMLRSIRRKKAVIALSSGPPERVFEPRPRMVGWFDPRILLQTALVTGLGLAFASYTDRRDTLKLRDKLENGEPPDYATKDAMWFDFVADVGDGFGPTFAIASGLARPALQVAGAGGGAGDPMPPLPRGEILIMGGDEIYPAPSRTRYVNQTTGPYELASQLLSGRTGDDPPAAELVVLPGNHDWYDGLTNFLHTFSSGGRMGLWKTYQRRTYWARQLPQGWWLFGVDAQLGGWIDALQIQHFRKIVEAIPPDTPTSIIVCWSTPVWVGLADDDDAMRCFDEFEEAVLGRREDVTIDVVLTGDLHHYARYEGHDRQWITAGGGGAFLHPTHDLPEHLPPPGSDTRPASTSGTPWSFDRREVYPSEAVSRRRRRWLPVTFVHRNPSFVLLGAVLAFALSWAIQVGARAPGQRFAEAFRGLSYGETLGALLSSSSAIVLAGGIIAAMIAFAKRSEGQRGKGRDLFRRPLVFRGAGAAHGVIQVLAAAGVTTFAAWALRGVSVGWVADVAHVAVVAVLGGTVMAALMGAYLSLANRVGMHANEAYSALHIGSYKGFLRFAIDSGGTLTIYPLKLEQVPAPVDWFDPDPASGPGQERVVVADCLRDLAFELIEAPITVRRRAGRAP